MLHKLLILLAANAVLVAVWFVVLKHKRDLLIPFLAGGIQLPNLAGLLGLPPSAFFASWQGYVIFAALASVTAVLLQGLRALPSGVEINHVVPLQPHAQRPE